MNWLRRLLGRDDAPIGVLLYAAEERQRLYPTLTEHVEHLRTLGYRAEVDEPTGRVLVLTRGGLQPLRLAFLESMRLMPSEAIATYLPRPSAQQVAELDARNQQALRQALGDAGA